MREMSELVKSKDFIQLEMLLKYTLQLNVYYSSRLLVWHI